MADYILEEANILSRIFMDVRNHFHIFEQLICLQLCCPFLKNNVRTNQFKN